MVGRIPVVLDNIIFSLQRMGGASVYWKQILEGIQRDDRFDLTIVERADGLDNKVRQALSLSAKVVRRDHEPKRFAQFTRVSSPVDDAIFHSSCYRVAKNKQCINVTTVHDFVWAYYISGLNKKIHMWQIRNAVIGSKGIICISDSTKRDLCKFIPEASKKTIEVIPHGYDADSYTYAKRDRQRQAVFIGARTAQYKNFGLAVESVSRVSNLRLVICGAPLTEAERRCLEEKIPGRYVAETYPSSKRLCEVLQESIALLYLSEYEGFGLPVLEGMAAGVPVVAINRSSIPEVAGDAGILLDEGSPELVAERLNNLMDDSAYLVDRVDAGLERVKLFSWNRTVRETADFYERLYRNRL